VAVTPEELIVLVPVEMFPQNGELGPVLNEPSEDEDQVFGTRQPIYSNSIHNIGATNAYNISDPS
jgi:hypothetical protein